MSGPRKPFGYIDSVHSAYYEDIAERYAELWSQSVPDAEHYMMVRIAYMRWMRDLAKDKEVWSEDGAALICGPGFDVASKEFNREIIETELARNPGVIIADFSTKVLRNAYEALAEASRDLEPNLVAVRRDFSGGLSAKFDHLMLEQIDQVLTPGEWRDLIERISKIRLEDVQGVTLSKKLQYGSTREIMGFDDEERLHFQRVLRGRMSIRFVIANLLLDGMFVTTEAAFREKLIDFSERGELSPDEVRSDLESWHNLIGQLNTHVAKEFIVGALECNPDAKVFATIASDTTYYDLPKCEPIRRVYYDKMKAYAFANNIILHHGPVSGWMYNDKEETPPHRHSVIAVVAEKEKQQSTQPQQQASNVAAEKEDPFQT